MPIIREEKIFSRVLKEGGGEIYGIFFQVQKEQTMQGPRFFLYPFTTYIPPGEYEEEEEEGGGGREGIAYVCMTGKQRRRDGIEGLTNQSVNAEALNKIRGRRRKTAEGRRIRKRGRRREG